MAPAGAGLCIMASLERAVAIRPCISGLKRHGIGLRHLGDGVWSGIQGRFLAS